jgi:DNA-binding beta-propeller fold protein YncE
MFKHDHEAKLEKIKVGGFPNGLAFDPSTEQLLAANVATQEDPAPTTVSLVDAKQKILDADIVVPGRTRWTVFDEKSSRFYVNIANPPKIIVIDAKDPDGITSAYEIPATGPHGLDLDPERRRLFCACDQGSLFTVEIKSGKVSLSANLAGPPDVIFFNPQLQHLYVTIGDPGVIEVFETEKMKLVERIRTESGAHTIAYNPDNNKVYAFLPETHRASIWIDK